MEAPEVERVAWMPITVAALVKLAALDASAAWRPLPRSSQQITQPHDRQRTDLSPPALDW